ncbi:MAG TPA: peptide chain release factor N(5)-glutamine methyltransferase, partial [Candidatus Limnocylindrales bacterium]|nr:peptide chain release factor N(5)-glutamine methyltransferase [Candidatus Limnocylindrales bacterium]
MTTVGQLLRSGTERLRVAGRETPRLDAELILADALGVDRTTVLAHPEAAVGADAERVFESGIRRREAGEPVAYIRGIREFYGLAFAVDRRALIPRPETELLVELAEREVLDRLTAGPRPPGTPPLRVADVGTGCGAIAVALAVALRRRRADFDVEIVATESSPAALELARENAVGHGVADRIAFVVADLFPPSLERPFALVLANLPYVRSAEIDDLPVSVRAFEPREALDGGPDGLGVIRAFLGRLPEVLEPGGRALFEIGEDQADAADEAVA